MSAPFPPPGGPPAHQPPGHQPPYGQPPYGGGFGGPPAGPPPQPKSNTLKYLGIGCGVLTLLALACGGGFYACWAKLTEAKPHAHAFLRDLREMNYPSALQRMDGAYQSRHNVQSFQGSVAQIPALTTHTDATLTNFNTTNMTTTVEGTLTTPSGPTPVVIVMNQVGEYFYIQSVTVSGVPLQ
ncbi:MAG: hypothetical protein AAGE52_03675 [Myxococcota bacterium]